MHAPLSLSQLVCMAQSKKGVDILKVLMKNRLGIKEEEMKVAGVEDRCVVAVEVVSGPEGVDCGVLSILGDEEDSQAASILWSFGRSMTTKKKDKDTSPATSNHHYRHQNHQSFLPLATSAALPRVVFNNTMYRQCKAATTMLMEGGLNPGNINGVYDLEDDIGETRMLLLVFSLIELMGLDPCSKASKAAHFADREKEMVQRDVELSSISLLSKGHITHPLFKTQPEDPVSAFHYSEDAMHLINNLSNKKINCFLHADVNPSMVVNVLSMKHGVDPRESFHNNVTRKKEGGRLNITFVIRGYCYACKAQRFFTNDDVMSYL